MGGAVATADLSCLLNQRMSVTHQNYALECTQLKGVCKSSEIQDNYIFLTKLPTWRAKEHFLWAFVLSLTFIYLISFPSHDNPARQVFLSVYR